MATAEARKAMSHVIAELTFIKTAPFQSRSGRFCMGVRIGQPRERFRLSGNARRTKRPEVGEEDGQNETVLRALLMGVATVQLSDVAPVDLVTPTRTAS